MLTSWSMSQVRMGLVRSRAIHRPLKRAMTSMDRDFATLKLRDYKPSSNLSNELLRFVH